MCSKLGFRILIHLKTILIIGLLKLSNHHQPLVLESSEEETFQTLQGGIMLFLLLRVNISYMKQSIILLGTGGK